MEKKSIGELIETAKAAKLLGSMDFLARFDYATLEREYNGIGPEWAGAAIRDKVTERLALFEPAALIHDLRNYVSDGMRHAFNYANIEFFWNCRKLADHAYPWWNWKRYRARLTAAALFDFVDGPGGWKAWREAHERYLSRQGHINQTNSSPKRDDDGTS